MRILIGGDIKPTERDVDFFTEGKENIIWGDLAHDFKSADFTIANLETPLIEKETPIQKSGAVFGSPKEILNAVKNVNVSFLNLANNHILDHGIEGLNSTTKALNDYEIDFGGAGGSLDSASTPYRQKIKNKVVSILSYSEHEFNVATRSSGGANPLDIIDFVKKIREINKTSDFIILLYHGGKENYRLPTPKQQKLCKFFLEEGVNMVVCQHSHIGGAYEEHADGVVFYGQGNFVFDPWPIKRNWLYKGFLIDIQINENNAFEYKLIPYVHNSLNSNGVGIRKMTSQESETYLNSISSLSKKMSSSPNFVTDEWGKLSASLEDTYLSVLNGNGRLLRKINEKTGFLKTIYNNKRKLVLKNYLTCETHQEILQTILKRKHLEK
ncbi:CapA family protein [Psychroserpens burtonensis]|uniref:CapA family protein n=1 Tax=Psychroserpens burtonensis TaxID=49278 RepID=A0A5C7BC49_9FLAO|nr:CapA family protein [Psychroserpens burtonensis]TXE18863.1 CapA family protein [Psychroserpens burtonensis]